MVIFAKADLRADLCRSTGLDEEVVAAASSGLVMVNQAEIDEVRGASFSSCWMSEFSVSKINKIFYF